MVYKYIVKPLLFSKDPEEIHTLIHHFGRSLQEQPGILSTLSRYFTLDDPRLNQTFSNITFTSPFGLAAGFDKNGDLIPLMKALGFGFTEIGSLTALPSTGNPKPRLFRLPKDHALINRMGLNNIGAIQASENSGISNANFPVGINIAKTHSPHIFGDEAIRDYQRSYQRLAPKADYITLNISCPNTAEGKTFEDPEALNELLSSILELPKPCPIFVKWSVDINRKELLPLLEITESFAIDGYIASNTSNSRKGLRTPLNDIKHIGKGGLSGRPLFQKSLSIIEFLYQELPSTKLLIGLGGVDSFESAKAYFKAGASLVQMYTGLVYEGPHLPHHLAKCLSNEMKRLNITSFNEWIQHLRLNT